MTRMAEKRHALSWRRVKKKVQLGGHQREWDANVKMDIKEIVSDSML